MKVACLMPTLPERVEMRSLAINSFMEQRYPADWNVQLMIDADPKLTLGAKLNRMIESSTADYFVLLDDDDMHSPDRVRRQVEPLLQGYELTGTSRIYYRKGSLAWLYTGDGTWVGGMAFTRALWERRHFDDISPGVDTRWQEALKPKKLDLADPNLFICTVHTTNTCKKQTEGPNWKQVSI